MQDEQTLESAELEEFGAAFEDAEQQQEEADESQQDAAEAEQPEEVEATFGESESRTEEEQQDSSTIREMRRALREKERELKRLQEEREALLTPTPQVVDPGRRPTLEECGWDENEHERRLDQWFEAKANAERARLQQEEQAQAIVKSYQETLTEYKAAGAKLKGFAEAEAEVVAELTVEQQNMLLLKAPKEAHLLVNALGNNPKRLAELSAIHDPVDFALKLGELKAMLKVAPKPKRDVVVEREIGTTKPSASNFERTKAQLKAEAERTGVWEPYFKFLRSK